MARHWVSVALLAIIVAGLVALVITLPLTSTNSDAGMPKAPTGFEQPPSSARNAYDLHSTATLERHCPCDNTWAPGTDERLLSNEHMTSPEVGAVPEPRGLSNYAWAFGQFLDHDIVLTRGDPEQPQLSIPMTPHDDVLLNVTRAAFRGDPECRDVLTDLTPAIDASTVYGDVRSDPALLRSLRADGGNACELRMSVARAVGETDDEWARYLPRDPSAHNSYLAGDVRNTEHPLLLSLHTLFAREHNRLCRWLRARTPKWNEEERFWKARQVVIAKVQHITYEEWLPTLLGDAAESATGPVRGTRGHIGLEFAAAAFRMGHSMVPDTLSDEHLRNLFFAPDLYTDPQKGGLVRWVRAGVGERALRVDPYISDGLRNLLFALPGATIGEDLATRNLARARELQCADYAALAHCYGTSAIAQSVRDPLLAALSEPLAPGSSLPPLLARIITNQFELLRGVSRASDAALGMRFALEVKATTLAKLLHTHYGVRTQDAFRV